MASPWETIEEAAHSLGIAAAMDQMMALVDPGMGEYDEHGWAGGTWVNSRG